jgi:hypothetical protein
MKRDKDYPRVLVQFIVYIACLYLEQGGHEPSTSVSFKSKESVGS